MIPLTSIFVPRMKFPSLRLAVMAAVVSSSAMYAQLAVDVPVKPMLTASASTSSALPDAPSALLAQQPVLNASVPNSASASRPKTAPKYAKTIAADEMAQPLSAGDKVIIGARDLYSVGNFGAMFFSSGYEQLVNGQPNFGTDKGAYGQRLGIAAVRETTEGIFTDMVFSTSFHQDPRYYIMGKQHNFVKRTLYAITRPLVGRSDSGRSVPNAALLVGYAASTAVTTPLGPAINRNFKDGASSYAGSIGGAALGFFVAEFTGDVTGLFHRKL